MKRNYILVLTCLLLPLLSMERAKDRTILFFGDSITQAATQPGGFIQLLEEGLKEKQVQNVQLLNAGIGGNKVTDLYLRLPEDVMAKKPDEVMIWVGINDVWHRDSGTGTDLNKFPGFYQKIIDQLKEKNIKVTLATPGVIGELSPQTNPHDELLDKFAAAIRELAEKNGCELIDFRKEFQAYGAKHNKGNKDRGVLTTDGVHLNGAGNQLVAELIQMKFKL